MAIAEQFLIDPGTEMIPTPPIHLPGFDLDQFAMHHDILIGYSTRLTAGFDPAPDLSRSAPPSRRTGAGLYWRERQGIIDTIAQRYEEWDEDLTLIKAGHREIASEPCRSPSLPRRDLAAVKVQKV